MEKYYHYLKNLNKDTRKAVINACITFITKQLNIKSKIIRTIYERKESGKYIEISVQWEGDEKPKLFLLLNDFDIRYYISSYGIHYDGKLYRFYHELMADIFGMPYAKDFKLFYSSESYDLERDYYLKDSYTDLIMRNRQLYSEIPLVELINNNSTFMIDIDGVILDTEERMRERANELGWKKAITTTNWHKHIYESTPIADSLTILKEITYSSNGHVFLLSTSHSYDEEREKINYFRDNDIILPIISVPPNVPKSTVIVPKLYLSLASERANVFLIDDQEKNIDDWWDKGGHAILFTNDDNDKPYIKVKSLDFLRHKQW